MATGASNTLTQDLRIELNFVTEGFKRQTNEAGKQLQRLNTKFNTTARSAGKVTKATSSFRDTLASLLTLQAGRKIGQTALEFDRVRNRMKFATGSAKELNDALSLTANTANRLGLELVATQRGFATISASAKGTALQGKAVTEIFNAVANASGALSLSADETNSVFLAFSQIISKGKVQAEELRGQIGERLPGAVNIASRALGVTNQELDKMLEKGEVLADDFLPKFARELNKTFSKDAINNSNSLTAQVNRLSNGLKSLANVIVSGSDSIKGYIGLLAEVGKRYGELQAINKSNEAQFESNLTKATSLARLANERYKEGNISLQERNDLLDKADKLVNNVGRTEFSSKSGLDLLGLGSGTAEAEEIIKTQRALADVAVERGKTLVQLEQEKLAIVTLQKAEEERLKRIKAITKEREKERKIFMEGVEFNLSIRKAEELKKELQLRLKIEKIQQDAIELNRQQKANDPNSADNLNKRLDILNKEKNLLDDKRFSAQEANKVGFLSGFSDSVSSSNENSRKNILAQSRSLGATKGNKDLAERQARASEEIASEMKDIRDVLIDIQDNKE